MRARLVTGLTIAATLSIGVGVALATFQPTVLYKPPALKLKDHISHTSIEDIKVRRAGSDFTVVADGTSPPTMNPASDPGCEFIPSGVSCPREAINKVTLLLGPENDVGDIDLGASADKVTQILKGEGDNDDLFGGDGSQKLVGGEGDDELEGGPGKDVLIGGPGLDICDGGPGKDTIKDCEPPPMRRFTQPMVLYKPPLVEMLDYAGHNSVENMVADEFENMILYSSTPVQVAMHPESDPGCDIDVSVACPLAGTEKIVMDLGAKNDSADFRLDTAADDIKQIAKGGAGKDKLKGRKGAQVLKGGEGDDILEGGDGDDTLIGGPGEDYCDGGKGHDDLKDCEGGKP